MLTAEHASTPMGFLKQQWNSWGKYLALPVVGMAAWKFSGMFGWKTKLAGSLAMSAIQNVAPEQYNAVTGQIKETFKPLTEAVCTPYTNLLGEHVGQEYQVMAEEYLGIHETPEQQAARLAAEQAQALAMENMQDHTLLTAAQMQHAQVQNGTGFTPGAMLSAQEVLDRKPASKDPVLLSALQQEMQQNETNIDDLFASIENLEKQADSLQAKVEVQPVQDPLPTFGDGGDSSCVEEIKPHEILYGKQEVETLEPKIPVTSEKETPVETLESIQDVTEDASSELSSTLDSSDFGPNNV